YLTRARGWRGAMLGIATLALTVATWVLLSPVPVTPRELLMWAVIAVLAGALCGFAGGLGRSTRPWIHRATVAVMAGLIVGEGVYGILVIGGPQWWFEALLGLALPFGFARRLVDGLLAVAG